MNIVSTDAAASITRRIGLPAKLIPAALALWSLGTLPSFGAENGVGGYLLGARGPQAGVVPPPGMYFQNDVYLYQGKAGGNLELPFNGQVVAGVKAKVWLELPTVLWSTPITIAGGNLGFSATLPIGGPSIDASARLSGPLGNVVGRNLHDSIATVGDPFLAAFVGWHADRLHWTTGVNVNVPAGDYQAGSLANVAPHRWVADVYGAATWLDPKVGFELSGLLGITFNGENPATDYTSGTEFHGEFAALQHFSPQFNVGLIGYFYNQITGDSGPGATLGSFKGRVLALGGTVGFNFLVGQTPVATRLKVYREFDVENRLEGTAAFITVAMPLTAPASK